MNNRRKVLETPLIHAALGVALSVASATVLATPWMPSATIAGVPTVGIPASPDVHPGKEFSDESDRDAAGAADPGQIILWDGAGGVADGIDLPAVDLEEVDATANHSDALFGSVITNGTAAAFSLRSATGTDVGGTAVYYETTGGAVGTWATPADVDKDLPPKNLDGLEVWGPEGAAATDSDTDRYSVFGDPGPAGAPRVSVFNADGSTYLSHSILAAAVVTLEPLLANLIEQIDLDALMVQDIGGTEEWDVGDEILFSLWPILDPTGALVYAGDAAYVLSNTAAAGTMIAYFDHGGHKWTDGWTDSVFGEIYNVDGLEALAGTDAPPVPEPGMALLALTGIVGLAIGRRRRKR